MWRYDLTTFAGQRTRDLYWSGPLPEDVVSRSYRAGTVVEYIRYPRPSPAQIEAQVAANQQRMAQWRHQQEEQPDLWPPPRVVCACCSCELVWRDARYSAAVDYGVCSDCELYLGGHADGSRQMRTPTAEEALLLPRELLTGDAIALLSLVERLQQELQVLQQAPSPSSPSSL